MKMPTYSDEKWSSFTRSELENLLANAKKKNVESLIARCEFEIASRPIAHKARKKVSAFDLDGDFVSEYHFVCSDNRGVIDNNDGTFWTGSWVVAVDNVKKSQKYGGIVALHEDKSQLSYRQGLIIDFRMSSRGMVQKNEDGVEFLIRNIDPPVAWHGNGAGEKGYRWQKTKTVMSGAQQAADGASS